MYLKPGDLIAIVSPSRAISEAEIRPTVQLLEAQGYRVKLGENMFNVKDQFAGTDPEKISDIQGFINDPEVRAIWSSRGGYGGVRIIDQLDLSPLVNAHKWMIGYSDFTVFHAQLNRMGVPSLHATMPVNVKAEASEDDAYSIATLFAALSGKHLKYTLPAHPLNREGNASGELVGGNLSILYSLCGSASDIDTRGKVLFLEDLDEYLYHIDRMMMNLKRTGKLDGLAALVVGGMSDMNDNSIPYGKTAEEIIWEHVEAFDFPVYFDFDSGHRARNLALRLGMKADIQDNTLILPS